MLDAEQFFSWNARENKAIAHMCAALDRVLTTGDPTAVECFPASLTNREFIRIAVDLCKRAGVNVAVLGNPVANDVTFVPLFATPPRRRPVERQRAFGSLAMAGAGELLA